MIIFMSLVSLALLVFLVVPWLIIITSPLWTLALAAVPISYGAYQFAKGAKRETQALVEDGVLYMEGLTENIELQDKLKKTMCRVLAMAPSQTCPKACGCIKKTDDRYVGVVRMFSLPGHHLVRVYGDSVQEAAESAIKQLEALTVPNGLIPEAHCSAISECMPATCPIRATGPWSAA